MENASKALIIAAGVLIGIMVLSLAVYLTTTIGSSSAQVHEQVRQNQLAKFNGQFTKYDGRSVTIYDILTVANLAKDNNDVYGLNDSDPKNESSFYISVSANTNNGGTTTNFSNYGNDSVKMKKELIKVGDEYVLQTYTCTVSVSSITGRVYKVIFNRN